MKVTYKIWNYSLFLMSIFVCQKLEAQMEIEKKIPVISKVVDVNGKSSLGNSVALIYQDDLLIDSISSKNGRFKFFLKKNTKNLIKYKKSGYSSKMVSIDTHIPDTLNPKKLQTLLSDTIKYSVTPFEKLSGMIDSKIPVAEYEYFPEQNIFEFKASVSRAKLPIEKTKK